MSTNPQSATPNAAPAAVTVDSLDSFTRAYITCALWSSNDQSNEQGGEPLDCNYGPENIAPETLASMAADCARFQAENAKLLAAYCATHQPKDGSESITYAGHDLWLSRNGHGAGFFDRTSEGVPRVVCDRLQDAARAFGGVDLYIGDDGQIHS